VKKVVRKILESSDVQINGNRPWDIRIHNPNFYESCPTMFKSRWPLFVAYDSWKCFCECNRSVD